MKIIGDTYRLLEQTEEGIYLAEHIRLHTTWLLKPVSKADTGTFFEEVPILKQCSAHAAFPMVAGVLEDEETWYLVEEYIPSRRIYDLAMAKELPDERELFAWMYELAGVMKFLQGLLPLSVTYGQMNPFRVRIKENGKIFMDDYREIRKEDFSDPQIAAFLAPEIRKGEKGNLQSDMYSVGVMFYVLLLAAHDVFPTDTKDLQSRYIAFLEQHWQGNYPPIWEIIPDISGGMAHVLQKLMDADPAKRYGSVEEFCKDIRESYRYNEDYFQYRKIHLKRMISMGILAAAGAIVLASGAWLHNHEVERLQEQAQKEAAYIPPEQLYYQDGNTCFKNQEYPEAVAYYELALEKEADPGPVYSALGQTYSKMASLAEDGTDTFSDATSIQAVDDQGSSFELQLPELNGETAVELYETAYDFYTKAADAGEEDASDTAEDIQDKIDYLKELDTVLLNVESIPELLYQDMADYDFDSAEDLSQPVDSLVELMRQDVFQQTLSYMDQVEIYQNKSDDRVLALYPTGHVYFGQWKDGKRNGKGIVYYLDTSNSGSGYKEAINCWNCSNWTDGKADGEIGVLSVNSRTGGGDYLNDYYIEGNAENGLLEGNAEISCVRQTDTSADIQYYCNHVPFKAGEMQIVSWDDLEEGAKEIIESHTGRDWYDALGNVYGYGYEEGNDKAFSYFDETMKDLIEQMPATDDLPD